MENITNRHHLLLVLGVTSIWILFFPPQQRVRIIHISKFSKRTVSVVVLWTSTSMQQLANCQNSEFCDCLYFYPIILCIFMMKSLRWNFHTFFRLTEFVKRTEHIKMNLNRVFIFPIAIVICVVSSVRASSTNGSTLVGTQHTYAKYMKYSIEDLMHRKFCNKVSDDIDMDPSKWGEFYQTQCAHC